MPLFLRGAGFAGGASEDKAVSAQSVKEVSAQSISTAFAAKQGATDDYGGSLDSFAARLAPNSGAGGSSSLGDSLRSFEASTGTFSAQALAPAPGSDTASPQKAAAAAAGLVPGTQPVDLRDAPLAAPTPALVSAASAPANAGASARPDHAGCSAAGSCTAGGLATQVCCGGSRPGAGLPAG